MKETRVDVFRSMKIEAVRLTHLPTGLVAEAGTRENAIENLGLQLSEKHPCYFKPIPPVPVEESGTSWLEPRMWKYRVC